MTFCKSLNALPYLGLVFLRVTVEVDGESAYHVIFEEFVQIFRVKTGEV